MQSDPNLKDGAKCLVIAGTHKGKSGTVQDINVSKTGHTTITVLQANGERFKTLAKNVQIEEEDDSDFLTLSDPAQRALQEAGVENFQELARWSEKDLLKLHGFGPKSVKILKPLLEERGLRFKQAN